MSDELFHDDVQGAWQNQNVAPFRMSLDEIHKRIEKLDKKIHRRNSVGYLACFFVIAINILLLFIFPNLIERIGSVLIVLAAGYFVYEIRLSQRHKKADAATPAKMGSTSSVEFYRAELQRQRDFHCGIWFWSRLVIFSPGPLVFMIGFQITHPELAAIVNAEIACFLTLIALAVPVNLKIARKYQRQINELESLQKDHS